MISGCNYNEEKTRFFQHYGTAIQLEIAGLFLLSVFQTPVQGLPGYAQ